MSARRLLPLLPFLLLAPIGDPPDDHAATVRAFRQHGRADTLDARDAAILCDRQRQPPGPAAAATDDKAQP